MSKNFTLSLGRFHVYFQSIRAGGFRLGWSSVLGWFEIRIPHKFIIAFWLS